MQKELFERANKRQQENTVLADSIDKVASILEDVSAEKGG